MASDVLCTEYRGQFYGSGASSTITFLPSSSALVSFEHPPPKERGDSVGGFCGRIPGGMINLVQ